MIRKATIADIERMLDLGEMMFHETRYRKYRWDREKVRELLTYLMTYEAVGFCLLAEEDGVVIGGIIAQVTFHYFGSCREIRDLAFFIDPQHRGNLTAYRLVKEYIRQAKLLAVEDIVIGVSSDLETEMVGKLYEKLGFKKVIQGYSLTQ